MATSEPKTERSIGVVDTEFLTLSRPVRRRVVRNWIGASPYDGELTANRVDAVLNLADRNRSGASVEIGAGWTVTLAGGMMSLRH